MGDEPLGVLRQGFAANRNNAGLDVGDNLFAQASATIRVFFPYSKEIRKIIYTTNAIESLHMTAQGTQNPGTLPQ